MTAQVVHGFPITSRIPLDTDAIHPDAVRAALAIGVDRLELESERQGRAIDWATFSVIIRPDQNEEGTSRMSVTAKTLV